MHTFKAIIEQFEKKGEKSGWKFIYIPIDVSDALSPTSKKSFRVKGSLDNFPIEGISLLPMGDGIYILPMNELLRKGTGKSTGATLTVRITIDTKPYELSSDFVACLEDAPSAHKHFMTLTKSHQNYFSKWIDSAKTETTKSKRITQSIQALEMGLGYPEMIRMNKK
jgi:hypothetical protein